MIGKYFQAHGEFCASHPWEVILTLVALTICGLTMDNGSTVPGDSQSTFVRFFSTSAASNHGHHHHRQCLTDSCEGFEQGGYNAADVILMTIVRCSAVLYCYYQFRKIYKCGSKSILGIAALFTVFSTFIFTSSIVNFMGSEISDLKDALFFFLLLIDLPKAGMLAQLALSGSSQTEVTNNIAKGMSILGPVLSLDTVVETLVIGVGTLAGVHRLELLCGYAVMSVVVNYIVFMTFYPACLSLYLDLTRQSNQGETRKQSKLLSLLVEEEQKPNPVVQRVKVIMSTGLMIVHLHSRFTLSDDDTSNVAERVVLSAPEHLNNTEPNNLSDYIMRLLTISAEQIVILILLVALLIKFVFFEGREDYARLSAGMNEVPAAESASQTEPQELPREQPKVLFTLNDEPVMFNKSIQTEKIPELEITKVERPYQPPRPLSQTLRLLKAENGSEMLTDEEIVQIVKAGGGHCPLYNIEKVLDDFERGVKLRRNIIFEKFKINPQILNNLPYLDFDYSKVMNTCCENVLGYVPIPVGYAGPLLIDGVEYVVPMATTEGALVASTNRGCKALSVLGVKSIVENIGMTRAPCVRFRNIQRAHACKKWIDAPENFERIKEAFDSTSRFAKMQEIFIITEGTQLYLRFRALTGDAMGMNMVSKGTEKALRVIQSTFPDMEVVSLSGNVCADKKPAAINWIKGRGKRVVCEAIVPAEILRTILKTDVKTLQKCNFDKNYKGSALAGSIGGNNAHAANMVTAVFIACGQDPAQNVNSSNCLTSMEPSKDNSDDLHITCTMQCLEVGTVGGGTVLPAQSACLDMLGVRGAHPTQAGENAKQLARVICATVMAGELSLMAALVNNELVNSHMRHNRSSVALPNTSSAGLAPIQEMRLQSSASFSQAKTLS